MVRGHGRALEGQDRQSIVSKIRADLSEKSGLGLTRNIIYTAAQNWLYNPKGIGRKLYLMDRPDVEQGIRCEPYGPVGVSMLEWCVFIWL